MKRGERANTTAIKPINVCVCMYVCVCVSVCVCVITVKRVLTWSGEFRQSRRMSVVVGEQHAMGISRQYYIDIRVVSRMLLVDGRGDIIRLRAHESCCVQYMVIPPQHVREVCMMNCQLGWFILPLFPKIRLIGWKSSKIGPKSFSFFWEILDVIFIADGSNNLRFNSRFSKYAI